MRRALRRSSQPADAASPIPRMFRRPPRDKRRACRPVSSDEGQRPVVSEDVSPYNRAHEEVGREQPPWTCCTSTRPRPLYPARLRDIPDPPDRLWVRGDPRALARTSVAIVGSRRASPGSLDIAHRLASDLARIGLTIVSGLARGCDGAAHRGALDAGGATIAVLGSGPDVIYPPEHDALAEQIARQRRDPQRVPARRPAAAQSLPAAQSPDQRAGPRRDRDRGQRQERLAITAGCALAQGREVMVVPGTVLAGRNRGGHQLIRDGAALVENAEDVLAVLVSAVPALRGERERARPAARSEAPAAGRRRRPPRRRRRPSPQKTPSSPPSTPTIRRISTSSRGVPGCPRRPLLARLAELELSGQIARYPGGRFVRCSGKVIT